MPCLLHGSGGFLSTTPAGTKHRCMLEDQICSFLHTTCIPQLLLHCTSCIAVAPAGDRVKHRANRIAQGSCAQGAHWIVESSSCAGPFQSTCIGWLVTKHGHGHKRHGECERFMEGVCAAVHDHGIAFGQDLELRYGLAHDEVRRGCWKANECIFLWPHRQNYQHALAFAKGFETGSPDMLTNLPASDGGKSIQAAQVAESLVPELGAGCNSPH
mmetsp:Transcript_91202/g.253943  ORF Transcript_91202/g.253943 Transcript_91202/m.253943 type:complete len:214 (+) Transcript_91202:168-809(+)